MRGLHGVEPSSADLEKDDDINYYEIDGVKHIEKTLGNHEWVLLEDHVKALAELRAEGKYLKKSLDKWGSKWYPLFMEPFDLITSARARRKIRLWKTLAKQKKKETQERESLAKKLEKKLNTSQTPRSPRSKTVKKNTIGPTKNS